MSRNEDITTAIWVDLMALPNPDAKLLYVWSFTNEHNGMSGLYKIHEAIIGVETGLHPERLSRALEDVSAGRFTFYVDGVMWVRTRTERMRSRTAQIAKSIANDVARIRADHPLRVQFLATYGADPWLRDALVPLTKPSLNGTSGEVHVTADKQGDSPSLSRTSVEVPGQGEGLSSKESPLLPKDFPDELRAHLRAAFRVLRDLAERHNARAVTPLSLGNVVMARQHKQIVKGAYDFAAWADEQPEPRKNVVAGYRRWLDKTHDFAGFEQLDAKGMPAANGHVPTPRAGKQGPSEMWRQINGTTQHADPSIIDAEVVEESA